MKKRHLIGVLLSGFAKKFKEDGHAYKHISKIPLNSFENHDVYIYPDFNVIVQGRYGFYGIVGKVNYDENGAIFNSIDCFCSEIGYRSLSYLENEAMAGRDELFEIVRTYFEMFDHEGNFIDDGSLDKWIFDDDQETGFFL